VFTVSSASVAPTVSGTVTSALPVALRSTFGRAIAAVMFWSRRMSTRVSDVAMRSCIPMITGSVNAQFAVVLLSVTKPIWTWPGCAIVPVTSTDVLAAPKPKHGRSTIAPSAENV
jgi:hypothetical protein